MPSRQELRVQARALGLMSSGSKDELIMRTIEWLTTAHRDKVFIFSQTNPKLFQTCAPFSYRGVRVQNLESQMPSHNGKDADRIEYVGEHPESEDDPYEGEGEFYVRFFCGDHKRYKWNEKVPVRTSWLLSVGKLTKLG